MSQNSQTHFKNLAAFKVCLTILGHYALKSEASYLKTLKAQVIFPETILNKFSLIHSVRLLNDRLLNAVLPAPQF